MATKPLLSQIGGPPANLSGLVKKIAAKPALLPVVFDGLRSNQAKIKYGSLKLLRLLSEKKPEVLYLEFDRLVALLDQENNILQWGAIIIIGNLASVDSEQKIESVLDRFLLPVSGPVMITAANTVNAAGKIALAKPALASAIVRAFLRVEKANYQTPECRHVVLGHVVQALSLFLDRLEDPRAAVALLQRQLDSPRNSVKKKAAALLRKHAKAGG